MLFSLFKHYLELYISHAVLNVSRCLYYMYFTTSISYGVENYFPRLWGTGISEAETLMLFSVTVMCLQVWIQNILGPYHKLYQNILNHLIALCFGDVLVLRVICIFSEIP